MSVLVAVVLIGGCSGEVGVDGDQTSSTTDDLRASNGVALNGVALNGVAFNGSNLTGSSLSGTQLIGATMTGTRADGTAVALRIDSAQQQADPDIWFYWISWNNAGTWSPVCRDYAGAVVPAVLAAGTWKNDGSWDSTTATSAMTFACHTVGAVASTRMPNGAPMARPAGEPCGARSRAAARPLAIVRSRSTPLA